MRTRSRRNQADFSQLPAELVRAIYRDAGTPGCPLSLKDRVVALGVCKAWLAALKDLPLARLALSHCDKELCKWAILTKPSVLKLHLNCGTVYADLLPQLLHATPSKALRELKWGYTCGSLASALPSPGTLSNLAQLHVGVLPHNTTAWLGQLTALQQLTQLNFLMVSAQGAGGGLASPLVRLPPLPSLVALSAVLDAVSGLQLELAGLPSLQDLSISGTESLLKVVPGSAPAGKLRRLFIDVQQLSLDFGQLPALETATLGDSLRKVPGAASIAACSSLSRLLMGEDPYNELDRRWVAQLLSNAPTSLRVLSLELSGGRWEADIAAAIGALTQLELLSLKKVAEGPMPLPPEGAALWNYLRALDWRCDDWELPLPQAIRSATRLEALQVCLGVPSIEDLDLISSLPSLRKLALEGTEASEAVKSSTESLLRRSMPQLQQLQMEVVSGDPDPLYEWALND